MSVREMVTVVITQEKPSRQYLQVLPILACLILPRADCVVMEMRVACRVCCLYISFTSL